MNGSWSRLVLEDQTAAVYRPAGPALPRFGVLYLHSIQEETLENRPAFTRVLDELQLLALCPNGKQTWWSDRLTRHFDARISAERYLLEHLVPFAMKEYGLAERSIGLLGVSMGGQGALRLAFRYPERFPVVAAIAPALEYHELHGLGSPLDEMYDSREQCRQDTAPMHVPPSHPPPHVWMSVDPSDRNWARGCDRLHEKLAALGVAHHYDGLTSGGGHGWEYFDRMAGTALGYVHAGLVQESRRLL